MQIIHQLTLKETALRTLTTVFLTMLIAVSGFSSVKTSDEALNLVNSQILGGGIDSKIAWKAKNMSYAGETVGDWRGDLMSAPDDGWFIFIDDYPTANWEHPCRYFFVTKNGQISHTPAMTPPYEDWMFEPAMTTMYQKVVMGENRYPTRTKFSAPADPYTGDKYAVLVSGGYAQSSNHIRYWNDLSNIYCCLVDIYGFLDENIFVLCSDGLNPAPDQSNNTNSNPDLDRDGDADIIGPALLNYVDAIMDSVAGLMTADDFFLYFETDHGSSNSGWDVYANLWSQQELEDDHFAQLMAAFPNCEQAFCFEQCFSGGFEDDLMNGGITKRTFASACAYNQYSYAMSGLQYDEFVFDWTAALRGEDAYGVAVDADYNNDTFVSMAEAFRYAKTHDVCNEAPQYASNPGPFGVYETLDGLIEFYNIRVNSVNIDDDNTGLSSGNGNGAANAGETIELSFDLRNVCTLNLQGMSGTLASTDPNVTIMDNLCTVPNMALLGSCNTDADPFLVQISAGCPAGYTIPMTLTVEDASDSTVTLNVNIVTGTDIGDSGAGLVSVDSKLNLKVGVNPFNPETTLEFTLPETGYASLKVYDSLGREAMVLAEGMQTAGLHTAVFNGVSLPSGIYFCQLQYAGEVMTVKALLVK